MARTLRLRELLVGVEGLALLRHLYDGSDEDAERRLREVRRLVDDDSLSGGEPMIEADPITAYTSWSETYDEPGNQIIALEEPVIRRLLGDVPAGRALDAACGTGRHAAYLAERGHDVLGVDVTPEMVRRATANVPQARFLEGDLRALPAGDGEFDLAVCGLALAHLPDLHPAVVELARVLRPGGRLVVSVLHPFQAQLGWHASFSDSSGRRGFVREQPHTHARYLGAFRVAGLAVRDCVEPELDREHLPAKRRAFAHIPEAALAAYLGLPAVLVWDLEKAG